MHVERFWHGALEEQSPEQLRAGHWERLRSHLPTALASPFLRSRWLDAGVDPDSLRSLDDFLAAAPTIDKTSIIEAQATRPPYGTTIAVPEEDLVRTYISPGPEAIFFTREDLAHITEQTAWALHTNGTSARDVVDVTPMYHWVLAGTMLDDGYRRLGCNVIPGGAGSSQMHVEHMRWARVTAVFTFPTFLEQLAAQVEEAGLDPRRDLHLRLATIAGEMRSDESRARMEAFFGCAVREIYGGAEVPNVAAECGEAAGMHLNPEYIVEVVDPEAGTPVDPGHPGMLVLSDLARRAFPILRYATGDITAGVDPTPCGCGRRTPRMGKILGRVGDVPRVKGLFVVPKQVAAAVSSVPATGAFQLLVDRPGRQDRLRVRVEITDPGAATDETSELLTRRLKEQIRLSAEVELVPAGTLEGAPAVVDERSLE